MEKYLINRIVKQKREFKIEGAFESMYAAERWLTENGYGYGSSCAMMPTAIVKGNYYEHELELPNKWKNFTAFQKKNVDGVMVGDKMDGPVFIYLFN